MPYAATVQEYIGPVARGPSVQHVASATELGLPASIGSSVSVTSSIIGCEGYNLVSFALTPGSPNSVNVKAQAYIDLLMLYPQGSAVTTSTLGTAGGSLNLSLASVGGPFQSLVVTVSNGSTGGPVSLSNILALMQAT